MVNENLKVIVENKKPVEEVREIENKGRIRCSGCSLDCHMKYYNLTCSDHRGVYRTSSYDSFTKSLNLAFKSQRR